MAFSTERGDQVTRAVNHPRAGECGPYRQTLPTAFAISRKLAPCSRSRVISLLLTIRRGRPNVFPLSLGVAQPGPNPFLNE